LLRSRAKKRADTPAGGDVLRVKSPQDLGAGIIITLIGIAGVYFGKDLAMGSAARMGPGYFPTLLSYLIIALGLIVLGRSFALVGPPIDPTRFRPVLLIIGAILTFGALIEYVGLFLTTVVLTLMAAYARPDVKLTENLVLGVGMALFSIAVFVYALGQALPPWWGR
jgi:hypothetical protein